MSPQVCIFLVTRTTPSHCSLTLNPQLTDIMLSNSTNFAHINPITSTFMGTLNNEYITPGNGSKPCISNYDTGSVSQSIDNTSEGNRHPEIAMKQYLCSETPDPPGCLTSTTIHKNDLLHETLVVLFADYTAPNNHLHLVCCIPTTPGMSPLCECDASIREGGHSLSTFTDLIQFVHINFTSINYGTPPTVSDDLELVCTITKQFIRITFTNINFGSPPVVADDLGLMMCSIAATHEILGLCKCDVIIREGGSKLFTFTDLIKFVRVNFTDINCGSPPVISWCVV